MPTTVPVDSRSGPDGTVLDVGAAGPAGAGSPGDVLVVGPAATVVGRSSSRRVARKSGQTSTQPTIPASTARRAHFTASGRAKRPMRTATTVTPMIVARPFGLLTVAHNVSPRQSAAAPTTPTATMPITSARRD